MEKCCTKCKETKPLEAFYSHKRDGTSSRCRDCTRDDRATKAPENRERVQRWREQNPEKYEVLKRQVHYRKYGLSTGEVDKLIEQQDGLCKICREADQQGKRLSVDHDHETGKVRGGLCTHCNWSLLGGFGENPEFYERVAKYLRGQLK